MVDILFFACWFLLPFLWLTFLNASKISLFKISIPSILIIFLFLFQYLGLPILYFGLDEYRVYDVKESEIVIRIFLFTSLSITFFIFGIITSERLFGQLKTFNFTKTISSYPSLSFLFLILIFLICVFFLIQYINIVGFENLVISSFLGLASENNLSINALRSSMTNSFDGNYHWYHLFIVEILFFITLSFLCYRYEKSTFFGNLFLIASISVCSFSFVMSGQKAPILDLIIGIALITILINRKGKINFNVAVKYGFFGFLIVIPLYFFFMSSLSINDAISGVFSRTLTGTIEPIYYYLQYFPSEREFLLGATFPNPGGILPYEPVPITQELMVWRNPSQPSDVVGSLPTVFWVEAYINFGIVGILYVSFLIGFIAYLLNIILLRLDNNFLTLAFYVWIILFVKDLSQSFFSDYLINIYFVFTSLIFLLALFILGGGKFKYKM